MKGYSPVMNFEVEDFQASVKKFEGYGAVQDGEIVDNEDYQVSKKASRQASKRASERAGKQASRQASKESEIYSVIRSIDQ